MTRIITFAGPSLPKSPDLSWKLLLEQVQIRPPAQDGDVTAALDEKPEVLVLLDGYYFDGRDHLVPAVKPQELLLALNAGVQIIGAASMGAAYAAELSQFGVVGVGQVFDWFRAGILQGNDELIILHLPQEFGYQGITVAVVEVRYALQQLVGDRVLSSTNAQLLIQAIKAQPFTERSLDVILQLACSILDKTTSELLRLALASNSVKHSDAKLALQLACRL
ncbi:hypothetical protein H6F43_08495 [Leptolyngbya sp. FACHB-36]|uniref:TfuA-like protein n=1 Tax=Leptolyngbya sp. FACHB-36 TaxID=2692808 RepID=UPI0016801E3E|nr:TfuA-like protein [Leptolyngbya sp. FACHB-36]MBD2020223.1 hypothetical protein [Leptolyngbya sp. FACHB-36]